MATQLATRADNEFGRLRTQLETRADDFKMALPAHITPEKFQRTLMTAAQANPDILRADRASLITSAMKAAQDGLLPDGREAALVTFSTRQKIDGEWQSVKLVQYMPMAFGLRKKILQSGEISALETNVVYRREVEEGAFIFEAGTEAMLRHRPMLDLTDEDLADENIVAAYSVATMKDGARSFEVMRRAEINKVRQASQTGAAGKKDRQGRPIEPKGPWVDWFGEMARKTVMRRHSKTLPMSGDLIDVEAREDALYAASATQVLAAVEPEAPQALTPPTREQIAHAEGFDPETGEIDEDAARALDREGFAAMEGRADEEHGDQHDGDATDPESADARITRELIERCANGAKADIPNIEADLIRDRDALDPDQIKAVESEIAALKRRTRQ